MHLPWPQATRAEVVYSGIQDIAIPANYDGVFLNVVTQQHATTEVIGWDLNPFFGGLGIANSPSFQPVRLGTGNEDSIVSLGFGSSISGSLSFASGCGGSGVEDNSGHLGPGPSQFTDGRSAYFGFQVTRNAAVSYGWMQVTLTRGGIGVIQDWAYDTSGGALLVGATGSVGEAPLIVQAGATQTASASAAGTAVLVSRDSQFTFQQNTTQGEFSGVISGGGNINVSGTGGVRLSGSNTFTGTAAVLNGSSLTVTKNENLSAAAIDLRPDSALVFDSLAANNGADNTYSNPITINSDTGTLSNTGTGTVVLTGAISGGGGLNVSGTGGVRLSGTNTFAGTAAVLNGSSLTVTKNENLGAAAIDLSPASALVFDSLAANNGADNTYSNPITINSDTGTLSNTGNGTVVLTGAISGGGGLNVSGAGGVRLSGTNTFTGTAAVLNGSSLTVTKNENLGAAAIDLSPASALVFDSLAANNGADNTYSNPITITANTGTLRNTGNGTVVLTGTLTKNGSVLAFASGTFEVSGTILGSSDNSDLLVDGAAVTLSTSNSYNGPTIIRNRGSLTANVTGALPTTTRSAIIMDDSGSGYSNLILGANQQIASLTAPSTSTVALGSNTLTIGAASGSSTFAGGISGSGGSLVKDDASTLVLSGANSYGGSTLVSAGTLVVNGSLGGGAVSVSGTLTGTGTLGGNTTIQSGGTHAPGAVGGVGSQIISGNLNYASDSIFLWDLNTNSTTNTGGGFDTVSAAGDITVDTTRSVFKVVFGSGVDVTNMADAFWNTPHITQNWSLASIFGQSFYAGTFQYVETNYPVTSYGSFSISGTNLTWTAVPEPSSALAGLLLTACLLRRQRPKLGFASTPGRCCSPGD
jgi:autotransporter-associated beta strand protein